MGGIAADQAKNVARDELDLLLVVEGGSFVDGEVLAGDSSEEDGPGLVGKAGPGVEGRGVDGGRGEGFEGLVVEL